MKADCNAKSSLAVSMVGSQINYLDLFTNRVFHFSGSSMKANLNMLIDYSNPSAASKLMNIVKYRGSTNYLNY